jgi:hypothetical protein
MLRSCSQSGPANLSARLRLPYAGLRSFLGTYRLMSRAGVGGGPAWLAARMAAAA